MERKICLMTVSTFLFLGLTAAAVDETVDRRVADASRNALDLNISPTGKKIVRGGLTGAITGPRRKHFNEFSRFDTRSS